MIITNIFDIKPSSCPKLFHTITNNRRAYLNPHFVNCRRAWKVYYSPVKRSVPMIGVRSIIPGNAGKCSPPVMALSIQYI